MSMTVGGITLDKAMYWADEFAFTNTAGTINFSIDGHSVVQVFKTQGGRPMTLTSEDNSGWQKRSTVIALQALADNPSSTIAVVLPDGRSFNTILKVDDSPVMEFTPITIASEPDSDFWYTGTIKLQIL